MAVFHAREEYPGHISKKHVLRCLDLLIAGEENVAKAWEDSYWHYNF